MFYWISKKSCRLHKNKKEEQSEESRKHCDLRVMRRQRASESRERSVRVVKRKGEERARGRRAILRATIQKRV